MTHENEDWVGGPDAIYDRARFLREKNRRLLADGDPRAISDDLIRPDLSYDELRSLEEQVDPSSVDFD